MNGLRSRTGGARARALWAVALAAHGAGCSFYFSDDDDGPPIAADAGVGPGPDGSPAICLGDSERTADCRVDLAGTVVDLASGAPVRADVRVTTAWDTLPPTLPASCPELARLSAGADGRFAGAALRCDSPRHPPILLLLVDDPPGAPDQLAPTAIDFRLTCRTSPADDCGELDVEVPVAWSEAAASWRAVLAAEGVPGAATRGLVLLAYLEAVGGPAAGVVPIVRDGTLDRALRPGEEVRFVAADLSLVRADATATGATGLALIFLDTTTAYVGGVRGGTSRWEPTGVLFGDGWIFHETIRD